MSAECKVCLSGLLGNTYPSLKEHKLRNIACQLWCFHPPSFKSFKHFTVHEVFQSHLHVSLQNVERNTLDTRAGKF